MKAERLTLILTVSNLVLLIFNIGHLRPAVAQGRPEVTPLVRAGGLEIVDARGHVRASITVHGPEVVDGKTYPETVLLRMGDPDREPGVKLTTTIDGSALSLSNGSQGGVRLYARQSLGSFVRVIDRN